VWIAARYEPGSKIAPVFMNLGLASYGLYVLHTPIGLSIQRIATANGYGITIPYIGIAFIVGLTVMVLWIDKHFDQPMRKMLMRTTARKSG
jgi:peptidoglycan/LPS O-acetylase OafA/YrhL